MLIQFCYIENIKNKEVWDFGKIVESTLINILSNCM